MLARLILLLVGIAAGSSLAAVTPLPGVTPQRAPALTPFAVPIAVRVTGADGRPVANARVELGGNFSLQLEPEVERHCDVELMTVLHCGTRTDADGIARFGTMAGRQAYVNVVRVVATLGQYPNQQLLGEAMLELTADPAAPVPLLEVIAGNDQRVVIGTSLADIDVRLRAANGSPVANARVLYSPVRSTGGGFEAPVPATPEVRTDANGIARLPRFTASWGVGPHEASVVHFDTESTVQVRATLRYTATNARGGQTLQLGGLWWAGPSETGWGTSVFQHDERLFTAWFVYDSGGQPTWYVQPSGVWTEGVGSTYLGPLYSPVGSPWYAYDAARLRIAQYVGQGWTSFRGPEAADTTFSTYQYATLPFTRAIQRQPFGRGEPAQVTGVGDLWWGGPSQNGWGLAIHEQAGTLFMVWFTYGPAGEPTWFVMPGGSWDGDSYAGSIFKTRGPWWGTPDFDPSKVVATQVGSYVLRFESADRARMEIALEGRTLVLPLERQGF